MKESLVTMGNVLTSTPRMRTVSVTPGSLEHLAVSLFADGFAATSNGPAQIQWRFLKHN